jgi:hypothetical protein
VLPSATPDHSLGNTKEVSIFLADCINQLRHGELDPRVANALGYDMSIHLHSLEEVSAEAKVDAASQLYVRRPPDRRGEVIEGLQRKELQERKLLGERRTQALRTHRPARWFRFGFLVFFLALPDPQRRSARLSDIGDFAVESGSLFVVVIRDSLVGGCNRRSDGTGFVSARAVPCE